MAFLFSQLPAPLSPSYNKLHQFGVTESIQRARARGTAFQGLMLTQYLSSPPQSEYTRMVQMVLTAQEGDRERYQRLAAAFNTLLTANGVATIMSNQNTSRFKTNLREFLMNVRGFLCSR